jgi:hypothetical protein
MAVEILYGNIHELAHPDAGVIKLVYFGHKSEGQKKITRQVAEAVVLTLESNGMHIVNGLSEAQQLLEANGFVVLQPGDERLIVRRPETHGDAVEVPGGPLEAPGEPTNSEGDADV